MKIKDSIRTGLSFGLTSGVITTLGLMVGLNAGTQSKVAVIGGILTIAIADAFSDALGIHVSEESTDASNGKGIWESTISTFFAKFLFALTFTVPVIVFSLDLAIWISLIWGLGLLGVFSYRMAIDNHEKPLNVVGEHVTIAVLVVFLTNLVGGLINQFFV